MKSEQTEPGMETGLAKPRVIELCGTDRPRSGSGPATPGQRSTLQSRPLWHKPPGSLSAGGRSWNTPTPPLTTAICLGKAPGSEPLAAGRAARRHRSWGPGQRGLPQPPRPLDHQGGEQRARSRRHGAEQCPRRLEAERR